MEPLRICFASSEFAPFAKAGGLADVSAALTRYLHGTGHDVRAFLPLYRRIDDGKRHLEPIEGLQGITVQLGAGHKLVFSVYTTQEPDGDLPIHFIHCPSLFGREDIYTNDKDEHRRFLVFNHAVLLTCQRMGWAPHIIHCNDWQTGLIPLLLRTKYSWDELFRNTRTILTIHNIGYQGIFSSQIADEIDLGNESYLFHQEDMSRGQIGFLKTGLLYATKLTTVSPTYAQEIQTEDQGMGMEAILRHRSQDLIGILNGVDYTEWDPAHDPFIPHHYTAEDMSGKDRNREALLEKAGLEAGKDIPIVGMVTRLTWQKGLDLVQDVLPHLLRDKDFRFIILGSGEKKFEDFFHDLARRFAGKVHFHSGFSNELAHLIEAGSDIFLMPSRYEPCGLNQMYSLRYGTIPVVRRTGGLADTVSLFDPNEGDGTGVVFDHYTGIGLGWALNSALELYKDQENWRKLQRNGMARDYSWDQQGEEYVRLYRRLAGLEG